MGKPNFGLGVGDELTSVKESLCMGDGKRSTLTGLVAGKRSNAKMKTRMAFADAEFLNNLKPSSRRSTSRRVDDDCHKCPSPKLFFHHSDESDWSFTSASDSDSNPSRVSSGEQPSTSLYSSSNEELHNTSDDDRGSFPGIPLIQEVQEYAISTDSFFAFRRRVHHHDGHDDDGSSISSDSTSDSDASYDHGPLLLSPSISSQVDVPPYSLESSRYSSAGNRECIVNDAEPGATGSVPPSTSVYTGSHFGWGKKRKGSIAMRLGHSLKKALGRRI